MNNETKMGYLVTMQGTIDMAWVTGGPIKTLAAAKKEALWFVRRYGQCKDLMVYARYSIRSTTKDEVVDGGCFWDV